MSSRRFIVEQAGLILDVALIVFRLIIFDIIEHWKKMTDRKCQMFVYADQ